MSGVRPVVLSLCGVALACCGPASDPRGAEVDLRPPTVLAVRALSPVQVGLEFDEEARVSAAGVRISPDLAVSEVSGPSTLVIVSAGEQSPGCRYVLDAEAEDARGNSASFMADFYGFNPRIPRALINEFTTRGTESHPDVVEIRIIADGNMGGVALYEGTPHSFDERLIFPPFEVHEGDFILAHFKPTGDPGEVDETDDRAASGGLDASESAFDFWIREGDGIGGNNGVLSLYASPGGAVVDGVLYSNRTSQSDERYGGFGTAEVRDRAEELVRDGGWKIAGQRVTPEDGLSPEGSTGTRSICRSSTSGDTDSRTDWHIVPTRGASFGQDNSDELYISPP
jgi:hypothetical protein